MKKIGGKDLRNYLLLGITILLLFLAYKIISPYIVLLVTSFIFAYLVKPIFLFLNKRMRKSFSALICILGIFLVIFLPFTFILTEIGIQASSFLGGETMLNFAVKLSSTSLFRNLNLDLNVLLEHAFNFVYSFLTSFASKIPTLLLFSFFFFFSTYYILVEWVALVAFFKKIIPFKNKNIIAKKIGQSTRAIVFGYFLLALLEFLVASLGFYLSGVSAFFFLAFLVAFLVFIPGAGPVFVVLPMLAYYALSGDWFSFIGILITGLFIIVYMENLLSAKLLGAVAKIHPFIILLGVLGGTAVFGIFGFVIGPLILVYTVKIVGHWLGKD